MSPLLTCDTDLLRIAYKVGGPEAGSPVLLLHGWPDDATTHDAIAPALHKAGYRTYQPWLRGFGGTEFKSADTIRSGEIAALTQDIVAFCRALGLGHVAVVGHDWGARIAYFLSSAFPEMVRASAALSVGWQPGGLVTPGLDQGRAFWYQWFMATTRGQDVVRRQGKQFARFMWTSWSPPGWFSAETFDAVAKSFENPDWPAITLHAYQVRWEEAAPDPRYAALTAQQREVRTIGVPTLMIQGGADHCVLPASTEQAGRHFSGPYERIVLDGVGHFPTREAPQQVTNVLLPFLARHWPPTR